MKLIDLLVKELPKRGGWPVNISFIAQDEGFATWGFRYKPERDSDGEWMDTSESGYEMEIVCIGAADDCNTSVVSREQYEAALAASKAVVGHDGWIQWAGGECPVDSDAIVEVKCRWHNQHQYNNDRAGDFYWAHTGSNADIIAYRLQQPGFKSRANDDRLEQDLNECIGQDFDVINHPSHYTKGSIECIDAIDSATTGKSGIEAVCVANVIKYLFRYEEKNGLEDVKKAQWYLNKLISELESN